MIDHRYTSRAHPQANGQAERAVQDCVDVAKELGFDLTAVVSGSSHAHLAAMDDLFGALKRHYYGLIKMEIGESDEGASDANPGDRLARFSCCNL
ncbi:hypothetical protein RI054_37g140740 [Pseudoscourfieldia marina]